MSRKSLSGLLQSDIKETVLGSAEIQKYLKYLQQEKLLDQKLLVVKLKANQKRIIRGWSS